MTLASKIISGLLAFLMFHSPAFGFGGNTGAENNKADGKTVTVTVAQDGSGDYATLEEARDYVRTLDKSKYDGINVVIGAGEYTLSEAFTLTAEDSGTETCPIRYIGDGDARIYGGVAFTAADFEPLGDGEVVQYFPEDVKDKLVQIDLKQFGFEGSARDLTNARSSSKTFLYVNGSKMNEARFPNADTGTIDDYARVGAGSTLDPEWTDPNEYSGDTTADYYVIRYADEYEERVRSWHDIENVYVKGRFTFMWCSDDSTMSSLDPTEPVMNLHFMGGYKPREGMIFYWYHIPEELDVPGEYYIDDDLILYYYPMEGHDTSTFSIPVLNDYLVSLDSVDYVTLDNLSLESSRGGGIIGTGNHITVQDSVVQSVLGAGIYLNGTHITIQNNTVKSIGTTAIKVRGGDEANIIHSENLIYNNYVEDWSNVKGLFEWGIQAMGCGMTVSHNELCNSADWGIEINGVDILVEYNHIYNASLFEDDQAVIHVGGFGMIVRYNYVHDCGFVDEHTDYMGISGIDSDYHLGQTETYGNIVANVSGNGHLITNSDNANVHDNLYISCRKGAVKFTDQNYTNILRDVSSGSCELKDYMTGDLWIERFPFLGDIKATLTADEVEALDDTPVADLDPNYWFVPNGSSVKNNYVYIDKANLSDPGKGLTQPYLYYDLCKEFADIAEPTSEEITTYSSKRGGHPDIKEALEKAAGTINLPYEEFEKIGRVK